ncbi:MAG: hypothetical protein QF752_11795 [Planctomycetota bacterium]|jgi:hypothetical protein|nr:hypothetical protein [Planctomycetota bacterium]
MGLLYTAALGGTTLQILTFLAIIGACFADPDLLSPAGFLVEDSNRLILVGLFGLFALVSLSSFASLFTVWKSAKRNSRQSPAASMSSSPRADLMEEPEGEFPSANDAEDSDVEDIDI